MNAIFSSLQPLMAPTGGTGAESMLPTLLTFGAVFLIFYFLIIRPQNKKQKDTQKMLEALKKGDKVQSIGGIRGTIVAVKEDSIVVKVDDNSKIEFVRNAISSVLDQKTDKEEKEEKNEKKDVKKDGKKSSKSEQAEEAPAEDAN